MATLVTRTVDKSSTHQNSHSHPEKRQPQKRKSLGTHLIAGGGAGFVEALVCHPLDTIKMPASMGFLGVGARIVQREGPLALYKGLGAVITGIVPKMAIRFFSFEVYKGWMADPHTGHVSFSKVFLAGLGAGVTEAVFVVTPMDVLKIRLQAQRHSMADPLDIPKYRNAGHAAYVIVKEEGIGALYKGVSLTALRQATNQAVNFTFYQLFKDWLLKYQDIDTLPSWQHLVAGGVSGALGPISNAPIDTIKTRIQKSVAVQGENGWSRFMRVTRTIYVEEGWRAFYKGLTPRLLRVAPGQAITFMVYERIQKWLNSVKMTTLPPKVSNSLE